MSTHRTSAADPGALAHVPTSVDVGASDILQGIFNIEGMLSVADRGVTFAYQTHDARSKTVDTATLQLPLDAIRDVQLERRIRGTAIVICTQHRAALEDVPGARRNKIVFRVKPAHRETAATLVAHLQRGRAERGSESTSSISFQLPDIGLREISGEVYLDPEFLVFEVEDALVGEFDAERQVIKIEPAALETIRLDRGIFRDRIYIRPKKEDLLDAMPGRYDEALELKIWTWYRDDAKRLVDEVRRRKAT